MFQVDAFTHEPFKGNPAAVCLLEEELQEATMLSIAAEMNLSETAFVVPRNGTLETAERFGLRWFTPKVEVPLCGHATLATAWVLFYEVGYAKDEIKFDTRSSGELIAWKVDEGILLDFPADPPETYEPPEALIEALGIAGPVVNAARSVGARKLIIEIEDREQLRNLEPNFIRMLEVDPDPEIIGIIVTSKGDEQYDFISRFFAPWVGVDEDPVTGSAHTVLTPYWSEKLGKTTMRAFQASARGGALTVRLRDDERVELIGKAVTVLKGRLLL